MGSLGMGVLTYVSYPLTICLPVCFCLALGNPGFVQGDHLLRRKLKFTEELM